MLKTLVNIRLVKSKIGSQLMHELSLFSGAGGGLLASHLLGWRVVGYVESDAYCRGVLRRRMEDGMLDEAEVFGDVREFIREGYAEAYTGMVDVVTAGFPCQPFSVAGKREGAGDKRNLWPETMQVIRLVGPRYVFLENVPGLLNSGYFPTILGDLAEGGYDARWRVLSAAELGAPHKRDRLWIVAHATSQQDNRERENCECGRDRMGRNKETTQCNNGKTNNNGTDRRGQDVADAERLRELQQEGREQNERGWVGDISWWSAEPDVGRVAHGVPSRVDRLRALGNGQVPIVAATAWRLLTGW